MIDYYAHVSALQACLTTLKTSPPADPANPAAVKNALCFFGVTDNRICSRGSVRRHDRPAKSIRGGGLCRGRGKRSR